jgi:hypothetical protein
MTYDSIMVLLVLKIHEWLELTAQRWRDILLKPRRAIVSKRLTPSWYERIKYERRNIIYSYDVNTASALLS